MAILPGKIRPLAFLLNKMGERHPEFDMPNTAMLIGGGCSLSSGVPLSGGFMDKCRMYSFLQEEVPGGVAIIREDSIEKAMEVVNVHMERYQDFVRQKEALFAQELETESEAWLPLLQEFAPDSTWADHRDAMLWQVMYGKWFDTYSQEPLDRFRFVERMVGGKLPAAGYLMLAMMVENGLVRNLFTTNFEELLYDALIHGVGVRANVFSDDEYSRYITIHSEAPNLIKLSGDYRYALSDNSVKSILTLTKRLAFKVRELLGNLDLVVVGYNGTDHSIMSNLLKMKEERPYGLYWCGLNPANVPWRVAKLINDTPNSFFIKIEGFDELMGDIFALYGQKPKYDLVTLATTKSQWNQVALQQFWSGLPLEKREALEKKLF